MKLGAGRPGKQPTVTGVRELSADEVRLAKRGRSGDVKAFRDSHHMVARLFAMGLRPGEVAERSGYSLTRISTLYASPAFKDLIVKYRETLVDPKFAEAADEYFTTVSANRIMAARLLNDKLGQVEPDDISVRELVLIHADAADRTGYPKRTVATNFNIDWIAQLDRAVDRSKQVRALPPPAGDREPRGVGLPPTAAPRGQLTLVRRI